MELKKEVAALKKMTSDLSTGQHKILDLVAYAFESERERNEVEQKKERQWLEHLLEPLVHNRAEQQPVGSHPMPTTSASPTPSDTSTTMPASSLVVNWLESFRPQRRSLQPSVRRSSSPQVMRSGSTGPRRPEDRLSHSLLSA